MLAWRSARVVGAKLIRVSLTVLRNLGLALFLRGGWRDVNERHGRMAGKGAFL